MPGLNQRSVIYEGWDRNRYLTLFNEKGTTDILGPNEPYFRDGDFPSHHVVSTPPNNRFNL